jgi:DNA-binding NtrC family response regulator
MITVLYADADPKMSRILSCIFEKYDQVSIFPAGSGEEASMWLSRYSADVIVSAYDLPDMNGIALLQSLRSRGILLPFIFFSETDSVQVRNEAYQNDVFGFIMRKGLDRKPIMNLLRLILWAAGSGETEYPFSRELQEPEGDTEHDLMNQVGGI